VPLHNARDVRGTLSPFCRSLAVPARVSDSPSHARSGKRRLPVRLPRAMPTVRGAPWRWSIWMEFRATVRARGWIVHRGPDTACSIAISMPLPA